MRDRVDVCTKLESLCERVPGVRGAAYFGSLGKADCDRFSDIDLVVGCEPPAALDFLRQLHAALPFVLFRPFSEDRQPGGRYWFVDTNPFARLDVSFYDPSEFEGVVQNGRGYAQPPFKRVAHDSKPQAVECTGPLPRWSPLDHEFAGALRRFHESVKATARSRPPRHPIEVAEADLRAFEPKGVRAEAWELYRQSLDIIARSA